MFYGADEQNSSLFFDAQHVATYGAGGTRIAQFAQAADVSYSKFLQNFDRGGHRRHTYAYHTKEANWSSTKTRNRKTTVAYTVGQPVCTSSLHTHLQQRLDVHFQDVFWPMAHSVQTGHGATCARWAVEWSILQVYHEAQRLLSADEELQSKKLDIIISEQNAREEKWRSQCVANAHSIALCEMRGMYDYENAPDEAKRPLTATLQHGCAWAGPMHSTAGCAQVYYTPGCLINCDDVYYDPCLCETQHATEGSTCMDMLFTPTSCKRGVINSGRHLVSGAHLHSDHMFDKNVSGVDDYLLLSSMRWPASIDAAECASAKQWEDMQLSLREVNVWRHDPAVLQRDMLLARAQNVFMLEAHANLQDAATVDAYCDDLLDYWPSSAQHPLGYHPTMACEKQKSNVRGFSSWMTRDAQGATYIDSHRARNVTFASQVRNTFYFSIFVLFSFGTNLTLNLRKMLNNASWYESLLSASDFLLQLVSGMLHKKRGFNIQKEHLHAF